MKTINAFLSMSVLLSPVALSIPGCYHRNREVIVERRERPREVVVERPRREEVVIERR